MESAGIEELLPESVGIKESLGISKVIPNHVDHIPKWRTPRGDPSGYVLVVLVRFCLMCDLERFP